MQNDAWWLVTNLHSFEREVRVEKIDAFHTEKVPPELIILFED